MDTFASLALATEGPSIKLLDRKPHNRNEFMISKVILIILIPLLTLFNKIDYAKTYYWSIHISIYYYFGFIVLWRPFLARISRQS